MNENIYKDFDEKEINVPDKLKPENIGSLLDEAEKVKDIRKAKHFGHIAGRIAMSAAAIAVVAGTSIAIARGGITANQTANNAGSVKPDRVADIREAGLNNYSYSQIYKELTKNLPKKTIWEKIFGYNVKYETAGGIVYDAETSAETTTTVMPNFSVNTNSISKDDSAYETNSEIEVDDYYTINSQEEGVQEGDIIVTDGSYIYVLRSDEYGMHPSLLTMKAEEGTLTKMSELDLESDSNYTYDLSAIYVLDGKVAIVGNSGYSNYEYYGASNNDENLVVTLYVDVEDPTNPKLISTQTQSGYYVSSRVCEGYVYVASDFGLNLYYDVKKEDTSSYIPCINDELLTAEKIYCPESSETWYKGYTIITATQFSNPEEFSDVTSLMINSDEMYMSSKGIYFANYGENYSEDNWYCMGTKLLKFGFADGKINYENMAVIPGYVDGQYAFSEYEGYLRVATTVSQYTDEGELQSFKHSNSLYVLDSEMNIVGSVSGLAEGESIKSVRYIGNTAYVVTFRNTDPLFVIDISDVKNPKVLGELKTSGFSEYLHPYNGMLFGLGYEADESNGRIECVKMSMFDVSDCTNPVEVNRSLIENCTNVPAMYTPTALLIDPRRNLVGFYAVTQEINQNTARYNSDMHYYLYKYTSEGFEKAIDVNLGDYDYGARGIYIGNYLYIYDMQSSNFYIYSLNDYSYISSWDYTR